MICESLTILDKEGTELINVNKLKGKIVENELTVEKLAKKIGINTATFYRKLNASGETFTVKEVNLICKALNLDAEEAMSIFFADYVA